MTYSYQGIFEKAEDGTFWGYVPEIGGAIGAGDSLEDAQLSLRNAIVLWIEDARAGGDPIPSCSEFFTAPVIVDTV